jgi:hypothetical protein
VVVSKPDGRVRICADYSTGLNDSLEPHQYPIPHPDEVFSILANCSVFSKVDFSDAFLQVEVEEESRKLLTINTHRGLFQYNRCPFGVKIAPGSFQQTINAMIAGLEGVAAYMDDLIIAGKIVIEHDERLIELMKRIEDFGFHLKIEKCKIGVNQLDFLGKVVKKEGTSTHPDKVRAIKEMPKPENLSEIRNFLGAVNHYSQYVRNMTNHRAPLDELLKKDVRWKWSNPCQQAFQLLKNIISSDLLLTHYNPDLPIIVAADASEKGLGGVIIHLFEDGTRKPYYHVSRSLTKAEKNYSQIEKEGLSIIFVVTKFHKFIFGREFTLETDHKPLLSIFCSKKGIPVYTANRLQRWALTLLNYSFKIKYIKTTEFGYADVLSRLIASYPRPDEDFVIVSIQFEETVAESLNESLEKIQLTFQMIRSETLKDPVLQEVSKYVVSGWPKNLKNLSKEVKQYHDKNQTRIAINCARLSNVWKQSCCSSQVSSTSVEAAS